MGYHNQRFIIMNTNLKNKIVIITGGTGGIGLATAKRFLAEGATVILGDIDSKRGKEVADRILPYYRGFIFYHHLDLRDEENIRHLVQNVTQQYGGIDVIINNAAVFYFENLSEWSTLNPLDEHYQVGLRGPMTLIQESWKVSPRSRSGSVINISSVAGHIGEPKAMAYSPIKAAQKGFTLSCAMEMAKFGGWAVSISPGHTWTPVHQQRAETMGLSREEYENSQPNIQSTMYGKFLDPEEVGAWIVLAASPLGKPLTGQDIHISYGIEAGGFNRNYETAS